MRILALDSASVSGSCAIWQNGRLVAQSYLRCGLTHSETLMPQVEQLLSLTSLSVRDFDCIAVTRGPGSFTGLRIGVAAANGLAFGADIPCCGVSTLETLAMNLSHVDGQICAVMDARRGQVYGAIFDASGGVLTRKTEDDAVSAESLRDKITQKRTFLVGDGAELCYNILGQPESVTIAPEALRYGNACQAAALCALRPDTWQEAGTLMPVYLRLSQAERELRRTET